MEWLFLIAILIFSAVVHEVSHGAMANYLGDPTAKNAGRLTLNPLKHLDPIGSIIVPILLIFTIGKGIGWAKPVPINPYNFQDQKYGCLKVALVGPGSNLIIALVFGLGLRFIPGVAGLSLMFSYIVYINMLLFVFNLLPIPPLDGSHVLFAFLPRVAENLKIFLSQFGPLILLFIIFFTNFLFYWLSLIVNWFYILIVSSPPLI